MYYTPHTCVKNKWKNCPNYQSTDMPEVSQTGAERGAGMSGSYYPCCYVRDAMCVPTQEQNGKFNRSIKELNAKHGISLNSDSSLSICEQLKKY